MAIDVQKIQYMADMLEKYCTPTEEEIDYMVNFIKARKQLEKNGKPKPSQVLACPLCGAHRTGKVRTEYPNGYAKMCGCGFLGYISPTNSKNGGLITKAWNRAVLDYLNNAYSTPEYKNIFRYKER